MKPDVDYTLYLVTDREIMSAPSLEEAVASAVRGGCTLVQLREKSATSREFHDCALRVKRVTDRFGVPLIVNDRADIAAAVDAAGVHVGQDDLPVPAARAVVGPDKIVGASASNFEEAREAVLAGADYLGVGAMFATGTKAEAHLASLDELARIRAAFAQPIVVIGGIDERNAPIFRDAGVDGLSVVSAILARPDIEQAARAMRTAFAPRSGSRRRT